MSARPKRKRPHGAGANLMLAGDRLVLRYHNPIIPAIWWGLRLRVIVAAYALRLAALFGGRKVVRHG